MSHIPEHTSTIAQRLNGVRTRMRQAAEHAGRNIDDITLIAVSKFHPQNAVIDAFKAGQHVFGENRVQEARAKIPPLRAHNPQIKLHLIGGLQRNKAQDACEIADVIESLDRPSLAQTCLKIGEKKGELPQFFIEVNTGDEEQKFGIPREKADNFIRECQKNFGSLIQGLMCIPPAGEDPRPHFKLLRSMAHVHGLQKLSMGMSADYPIAIEEGATHIRVGTAIFGKRPNLSRCS